MVSCNENKKSKSTKDDTPVILVKKDTARIKKEDPPVRPPIINISDTIALKYIVLYMKDSAASSQRISQKLAKIYSLKLPELIKKQQLKIVGPPIAWYKSNKAPFFFEAGIPVNKKPGKLPKGIFVKTIGADKVVIAHFYGPYSITNMGYEALTDFLKSNKKKRNGLPYEIYVTDPISKDGKIIDPYKVQTDIVFPYQ
jgi:effector-binding domain-containing protein